jgi:hypothetical protein
LWEKGGHLPPASWSQSPRAMGQPGSARVLRAGPGSAEPSPRDARDAGAGHRCPLRPSGGPICARRIREHRQVSPGSRNVCRAPPPRATLRPP